MIGTTNQCLGFIGVTRHTNDVNIRNMYISAILSIKTLLRDNFPLNCKVTLFR